ncbi:Crp/Fnr family transcriptional regulator [Dethiothermospora halolimnae]|uniref:Crp/Fnr family transcriptional regulator n=1 Tax=Dethiothermospora halolimnae TaxID=3114390 RepID=UPI003CCC3CD1
MIKSMYILMIKRWWGDMVFDNYIREIPIFSGISDKELDKIKKVAKERLYKKGNILFSEGDRGNSIFIVKHGKVKVYKTSNDGREIILDIKDDGDVIAEVVLFSDIAYPATVEAIEDTKVYVLKNKDIEEIIRNNAEIALEMIKVLNKRLKEAQKKLKNMALDDTYARMIKILLQLCEKYGLQESGKYKLDLKLTREELANLIGTSRETASRMLNRLDNENLIKIRGRDIIILSKSKLKKWV